jgi:ABC-2 type transport system permease protein
MRRSYSQGKALWAITRASFKAIFAQPTAIVFSLIFPIIFILIFGAFGKGGLPSYKIAITPGSDTNSIFYKQLARNQDSTGIRITRYADTALMGSDLSKGQLIAILDIQSRKDLTRPGFDVGIIKSSASGNNYYGFSQALQFFKLRFERRALHITDDIVKIEEPVIRAGVKYSQIDFILPGQLGFSILFSTLFGIAFTFFTLREQLVLKRFYASPVRRIHILLGIGMSRLFFQLMNVVVLILFGHFFLNFTLQHGWLTFMEMLLFSIYMLFLLMGVGLIFSSVAKNDSSIPLLINLFGFPQMLLSGTFFPITVFPLWLQSICRILPLTQFNDGMRKISFEGLHIYHLWKEIGILGIWMIVTYAILAKVIKWE